MTNHVLIDPRRKFIVTLNALFSSDLSSSLPLDRLEFIYSRRTGRIRYVMLDGRLIATLRSDGGFALTLDGARLLLETNKVRENCIAIKNEVRDFIKSGRSIFCKHITFCGKNVDAASDVIILDEDGILLAVGKAILPYSMIILLERGAAARVRHSIND